MPPLNHKALWRVKYGSVYCMFLVVYRGADTTAQREFINPFYLCVET
jgi:hypothetical protein